MINEIAIVKQLDFSAKFPKLPLLFSTQLRLLLLLTQLLHLHVQISSQRGLNSRRRHLRFPGRETTLAGARSATTPPAAAPTGKQESE